LESLHFSLELPLGGGESGICAGDVVDLLTCIIELSLSVATAAVRLFQESAGFFQLSVKGVEAAFSNAILFTELGGMALLLLNTAFRILDFIMNLPQMFVKISIGLIGVVKGDLELVDVGLKLLLYAKSLGLTLGFNLKRSLHGIKSSLVALAVKKRRNRVNTNLNSNLISIIIMATHFH